MQWDACTQPRNEDIKNISNINSMNLLESIFMHLFSMIHNAYFKNQKVIIHFLYG